MKKPIKGSKFLMLLTFSLGMVVSAIAQERSELALSVGDKMPEFRYSKWIKGEPIKQFDDNKIYIFEFWATWCGPCIQQMPHLSQIAKEYAGRAEVIGVNVWEKVGDKPYESCLPEVEKFVKASGDRMAYHVVADNDDLHIVNHWLKPAAISGIPTTFVVKNEIIQWIGHPYYMDSILVEIANGTHDLAGFKKSYEAKKLASMGERAQVTAAFEAAQAAAKSGDLTKAFYELDNLAAAQPMYKMAVNMNKFGILLEQGSEQDAVEFFKNELSDQASSGYILADALLRSSKTFAPETYAFAYEALMQMKDEVSILEQMRADILLKRGELNGAIEHMEKAVELGKKEVNDPRYEGRIFQHTIEDYQEKLKEIQAKLK